MRTSTISHHFSDFRRGPKNRPDLVGSDSTRRDRKEEKRVKRRGKSVRKKTSSRKQVRDLENTTTEIIKRDDRRVPGLCLSGRKGKELEG